MKQNQCSPLSAVILTFLAVLIVVAVFMAANAITKVPVPAKTKAATATLATIPGMVEEMQGLGEFATRPTPSSTAPTTATLATEKAPEGSDLVDLGWWPVAGTMVRLGETDVYYLPVSRLKKTDGSPSGVKYWGIVSGYAMKKALGLFATGELLTYSNLKPEDRKIEAHLYCWKMQGGFEHYLAIDFRRNFRRE